ncbi:MAG TPA: hypothetical protein DD670_10550, partial [Planctomycetaceae bacterium]|nr:hypothetical protein [Planctomycetaceae bacterium]
MSHSPRGRVFTLVLCVVATPWTLCSAAPEAVADDGAQQVEELLDRIENAWENHDAAALERSVSDRGFLAVISRPSDAASAWVGGKKEMLG